MAVGLRGYDGVELEAVGCCAGCTKYVLVNYFIDRQKKYTACCQLQGRVVSTLRVQQYPVLDTVELDKNKYLVVFPLGVNFVGLLKCTLGGSKRK